MFRKFALALFCLFCTRFSHAGVAIIHGYDSVAPGERGFARALAGHAERWYKEFGVPCEMSDDRNLGQVLTNKKLALLVYVSQPTASQMSTLKTFVSRGGKLIVFYSSSADLAALMGMKQLGYQGNRPAGHWASMRFVQPGVEGAPEKVQQSSSNLLAMAPVVGQSRVIAWWHDRQGLRNDAAWLASSSGYWMTHVMLADGDAAAKAQLLLALAASYDHSLWVPAAQKIMGAASKVGGSGGAAGLQAMAGRITSPARRARATKAAAELVAKERALKSRLQKEQGFQLWQDAADLRTTTYEVYGLMQEPRAGEIRAVWDHSGQGLYPGNWKLTCEQLHNAGITDLYVNVAGAGFAYYSSRVLPQSAVFLEQGDQLAACIKAARPLGLRVHAWILCFSTERATSERLEIFGKRGWLIKLPGNKDSRWMDPAVPEVRAYLVKAAQEMATNYKLDGVHLDFVRYPDFNSSLGNPPVNDSSVIRNAVSRFGRQMSSPGELCTISLPVGG